MHIHKIHYTGHKANVSEICQKNHKISQSIGKMGKKKAGLQFVCIYIHSLFDFLLKLEGYVWEKLNNYRLLFCTSPCTQKKIKFSHCC